MLTLVVRDLAPSQVQSNKTQLSANVVEVMGLLSEAARQETDPTKKELYHRFVEAASQVCPMAWLDHTLDGLHASCTH
jgi:hypothetical protein